ncbi:hypothetical protein L2E82_14952 [Cichorium intybus]|uniref:Uncharacterized protein n=1 Tax=Cichorium intybus TaxID=13427 RepID=A0ACB9F1W0_CICIN|nr:hypothetical protein L2E82_14952 [Cichorium intybus]
MEFGMTKGRPADLPPTLSETQGANAALLEDNAIRWVDPNEIILGMAGISPSWNEKRKRPGYVVADKPITLLAILKGECPTGETVIMEVPSTQFMDQVKAQEKNSAVPADRSMVEKTIRNKLSVKIKASRTGREENCPVPLKKIRLVQGGKKSSNCFNPHSLLNDSGIRLVPKEGGVWKKFEPVRGGKKSSNCLNDSGIGIVPKQHPTVVSTELQMPPLAQKGIQVDPLPQKPDAVGAMDHQLFGRGREPIDETEKLEFPMDERLAMDDMCRRYFGPDIMAADERGILIFGSRYDVDDVTSSPKSCDNGILKNIMSPVAHVHDQATATVADGPLLGDGLDLCLVSPKMGVADVLHSNSINGNNDTLKVPEVGVPGWSTSDVELPIGTVNANLNPGKPTVLVNDLEKESAIPESGEILLEKTSTAVSSSSDSFFSFLPPAKELNHVSHVQGWSNLRESLSAAVTWFNKIDAHSGYSLADMNEERKKYDKMVTDLSDAQADRSAMECYKDIMTHRCDELAEKNKVLEASNKDLKRQVVEATVQARDLEDARASFGKKISELEAGLKERDDKLQLLENQLLLYQEAAKCNAKQLEVATNERNAAIADVEWMLKQGIPYSLQHLLQSEEFRRANAPTLSACIEFGAHKGSFDMKRMYLDELASAPLAHFHPNARERANKCFAALVTHEFSLLADLKAGKLTVEALKELLLKKKASDTARARHSE